MDAETYTWPANTYESRKRDVAGILWTLHLDGPIEDPSGLATVAFMKILGLRGIRINSGPLNTILKELTAHGKYAYDFDYVERDIVGKRCRRIALVVDPTRVPFPDSPFADTRPMAEIKASRQNPKKPAKSGPDPIAQLMAITDAERHAPARIPAAELRDESGSEEELLPEAEEAGDDVFGSDYSYEATTTEEVPALGVEVPEYDSTPQDSVIHAISILSGALEQMAMQPVRDLDALINERLGNAAQLLDQVSLLSQQNRRLEQDKTALAATLAKTQRHNTQLQAQVQAQHRATQNGRTPQRQPV